MHILDMSTLRIGEKHFFHDVYRTKNEDTSTNREQKECEQAVERIFRRFLKEQASFGLK